MDVRLDNPEIEQFINEQIAGGRFANASELVLAALHRFRESNRTGDFEPGELDRLLEAGEASGEPIDGEEAFRSRLADRHARFQPK